MWGRLWDAGGERAGEQETKLGGGLALPPALPSASDGKGRRARDGGQCYRRSSKSASRRRRGRLVVVGGKLPLGEAAGRGPLSARAKREPATFTARPRDGVCWTPARSGAVRRAPGGPGRGNARQVRGGRTGLGRRSTTPRQRSDARACYMGQSRGRGMLRRRSRCQPHHRRPPGEPRDASCTCDGRPLAAPGCNSEQRGGVSPSWWRPGRRDGASLSRWRRGSGPDGATAPLPRAGSVGRRGSASPSRWRRGGGRVGADAPLYCAGGFGWRGGASPSRWWRGGGQARRRPEWRGCPSWWRSGRRGGASPSRWRRGTARRRLFLALAVRQRPGRRGCASFSRWRRGTGWSASRRALSWRAA